MAFETADAAVVFSVEGSGIGGGGLVIRVDLPFLDGGAGLLGGGG